MVNTKYYDGYENEAAIIVYIYFKDQEEYELKIWEGYFESIMLTIMAAEIKKRGALYEKGIVSEWNGCTGWYDVDSDKSKIEDLNQLIEECSLFDIKILDETEYKDADERWKQKIEEVHALIMTLLKKACDEKCDVFIEEV